MLKMFRFIPVEGPTEDFSMEDTLENLQEKVGGYVEQLTVSFDGEILHHAYVDEDGWPRGLPVNPRATEVYQRGEGGRVGIIVGPMLVDMEEI